MAEGDWRGGITWGGRGPNSGGNRIVIITDDTRADDFDEWVSVRDPQDVFPGVSSTNQIIEIAKEWSREHGPLDAMDLSGHRSGQFLSDDHFYEMTPEQGQELGQYFSDEGQIIFWGCDVGDHPDRLHYVSEVTGTGTWGWTGKVDSGPDPDMPGVWIHIEH